ncbi:MAG: heme-binding beta-barrel domain-containing protein [Halieaceae bacterium]
MTELSVEQMNYGPLNALIGTWKGDDGMDVAPEPDGEEHSPFYEVITIEPAGDVDNAEEQELMILRYHQAVFRKSNDKQFHDQVGYWLWCEASQTIMQTLTIPRGVSLLAGGTATVEADTTTLQVEAKDGDPDWGIVQSPFMRKKARTLGFRHRVNVSGDTLRYEETTLLDIYDKHNFEHTDGNTLTRQR